MKLAATIAMAIVVVGIAQAATEPARKVTMYVCDTAGVPLFVKGQAQLQASAMFASIGVTLQWRDGKPSPSDDDAIAIELAAKTPEKLLPGALACALPYEGVHIRIFWDRIKSDSSPQPVLAHVIVHEITHILQGVA